MVLNFKILCSTVSFPCGKGSKQQYLELKLGLKIRIKKNQDCVTTALFSNISNITFVQLLVIYLCTDMHCY